MTASLFDQRDLAEITSDEFPGERLIVCRNPLLAAERQRKRDELLAAYHGLREQRNRSVVVRRARRHSSAGANPARQLSLQPVAVGADEGGNDIG